MAAQEGVFYRRAASPDNMAQGELVDRLMAKIAELESRLYERDLEAASSIPAIKVGRRSDASSVNHDLLKSLGDNEQVTPTNASAGEWVASLTSWAKRSTRSPEPRVSSDVHSISTPVAGPVSRASIAQTPTAGAAAAAGSPAASGRTWDHFKSALMGRYHFQDPDENPTADAATQQMREAAGHALSEANERLMEAERKLAAAEAARRELQEQAEAAKQLAEQVEALKSENLEAWQTKYELESEMTAMKAAVEGAQQQHGNLVEELKHMKAHTQIWQDESSSQVQKLQAESELLQQQLEEGSGKLAAANSRLVELKGERDSALQERQVAVEELEAAQAALSQLVALKEAAAAAQAAAAAAQAAAGEWQDKFMRERLVRRKLHEQLQVFKGNIRVMCRVRPAPTGAKPVITYPLEGSLAISDASTGRCKDYEFDAVFAPGTEQQQVFEEVRPLIRSCADGYNVCIFAYGQTGSGKTHTMEGPADNPGINRRALQELFSIAAEEVDAVWSFSVAVLEIYNEAVHDLLAMAAAGLGSSNGGVATADLSKFTVDVSGLAAGELPQNMDRVLGLVWRGVSTPEEVTSALQQGWKARATASTACNAASSRSHALVSVKVVKAAAGSGSSTTSMLHLVDLAGSERIEKSEVSGQQLKEAVAINKSLSALGDVISALQRRTPHIPFRNSKLTQVLQDSLCGSSKVLLVCNLSPEGASASESISSLNFASRAAQVELGMARKAAAVAAAPQAGGSEPDSSSSLRAEGSNSSIASVAGSAPRIPAGPGSSPEKKSGAVAGRPGSRLSERLGSSSPAPPGSPSAAQRLVMAKPARH